MNPVEIKRRFLTMLLVYPKLLSKQKQRGLDPKIFTKTTISILNEYY